MAEILDVADRILVMAGGSLVAELDLKRQRSKRSWAELRCAE
jgi:ABC-type sugar transport system ATPase subunit